MRIIVSNFSAAVADDDDVDEWWDSFQLPPRPRERVSLFEQTAMWGFHLTAPGVYLMDRGVADQVEFWDYRPERRCHYQPSGVLEVMLRNERDALAYLARTAPVDLFVNHGWHGSALLEQLAGTTFRVHVPTLRSRSDPLPDAECYLLDATDQLIDRSMLYMPVVNTTRFAPGPQPAERDFVYLAANYVEKRHDLLLDAVRGTDLTGHLHPVDSGALDLAGTRVTTSDWGERDPVELLQTSRCAVYPADHTSNPAAMWECIAADLPIVVNEAIEGGRHVVVPGVTGELVAAEDFADAIRRVVANRDSYRPRAHLRERWDTVATIEAYLDFYRQMGWDG